MSRQDRRPARAGGPVAFAVTLMAACALALILGLAAPAAAQDGGSQPDDGDSFWGMPDPNAGEVGSEEDCTWTDNAGCVPSPADGDGEDDSNGSDAILPDENGAEEGNGQDDDGDGSTTDNDSALGGDNAETGGQNNDKSGGASCTILGHDICATALSVFKQVIDGLWNWFVGIAEKMAEGVMEAAYGLPSLEDSELGGHYKDMADHMKPAIPVLILLLSLGMILQPGRVSAQYALLQGLPKIAFIAISLVYFPDFVAMMNDITTGIGMGVTDEADVGGSLGKIFADAAIIGTAAGLFTANPAIGAIVAGLVLLPLIVILLFVLCVAVFKNYLFSILCLIGPVCLICWAIPGLSAITGIWFRSLVACFMIPVLFSIETAVGSWLVDNPFMGAVSGEAQNDWAPAFSSLALIVLLLVMCATPKKVLDWAFAGVTGSGGFSFRGAKRGIQSYTKDLAKGIAGGLSPTSAAGAAALQSAGRGGLRSAAVASMGQGIADKARGLRVGGLAGKMMNGASRGAQGPSQGSSISSGPGKQRGLRNSAGDQTKRAAEALGQDPPKNPNGEGLGRNAPRTQDATAPRENQQGQAKYQAVGDQQRPERAAHAANIKEAAQAKAAEVLQGAQSSTGAADLNAQAGEAQAGNAEAAEVLQGAESSPGAEANTAEMDDAGAAQVAHDDQSSTGAATQSGGAGYTEPGTAEANYAGAASTSSGHGLAGSLDSNAQAGHDGGGYAGGTTSEGGASRAAFAHEGLGASGLSSVAEGAEQTAAAARAESYQASHDQFTADGNRQAAQRFGQADDLRAEAQSLPGAHNAERSQMLQQADGLVNEGKAISGSLSGDAHQFATREAADAGSQAMETYAGDVASAVATERHAAMSDIAHSDADGYAATAAASVSAAEQSVSAARLSGLDRDNPQAFRQLQQDVTDAKAEHAAWKPAGASRGRYVRDKAQEAFRAEYGNVYRHATGTAPHRVPPPPASGPVLAPPADPALGGGQAPAGWMTSPKFEGAKK